MEPDIGPSKLGTQIYWNSAYATELDNFKDHGDVGEIWFGKETSRRITNWLKNSKLIHKDSKIIDIGCGNGMLLIELFKQGFTNLYGIDYSQNAIDLAKAVSSSKDCNIHFFTRNILENDEQLSSFDIAIDKGTYDAISLNPNDAKGKQKIYIQEVKKLLCSDGILLITSCNWTEAELIEQFSNDFTHVETLPSPSFSFGGKVGHTVTSLIWKKL